MSCTRYLLLCAIVTILCAATPASAAGQDQAGESQDRLDRLDREISDLDAMLGLNVREMRAAGLSVDRVAVTLGARFQAETNSGRAVTLAAAAALSWMQTRTPEKATPLWRSVKASACSRGKACAKAKALWARHAVENELVSFDYVSASLDCQDVISAAGEAEDLVRALNDCAELLGQDDAVLKKALAAIELLRYRVRSRSYRTAQLHLLEQRPGLRSTGWVNSLRQLTAGQDDLSLRAAFLLATMTGEIKWYRRVVAIGAHLRRAELDEDRVASALLLAQIHVGDEGSRQVTTKFSAVLTGKTNWSTLIDTIESQGPSVAEKISKAYDPIALTAVRGLVRGAALLRLARALMPFQLTCAGAPASAKDQCNLRHIVAGGEVLRRGWDECETAALAMGFQLPIAIDPKWSNQCQMSSRAMRSPAYLNNFLATSYKP